MRPPQGLVFAHTRCEAAIDRFGGPSQDRGVRTRLIVSFVLLASCTSGSAPAPNAPEVPATPSTTEAEPPTTDAEPNADAGETVGPIREGMSAEDVVAALGEPTEKPGFVLMEATGEFVSDWPWPDKDLTLSMMGTDEAGAGAKVGGITCGKSCAFELPHGLKIGSSRAEVEAVYGENFDKAFTDENTFVAGSVYGGSFYAFEDGKVVGIFIGAGAE